MNLIAHRWRRCLLGTNEDVYRLRTIKLTTPIMESLPVDEIDRDLKRTFPLDDFFTKHIDEIRNVLLWYAWTNPSVSYCQCFSFIAFIMFKVFYENDPRHAMIDTYYALHKIILLIKPLIPKHSKDVRPLGFVKTLRSSILLDIMSCDRALYHRLKNTEIINYMILSGVPSLYLNWFTSKESTVLLDYIITDNASTMFRRIMNFLVARVLVHKSIFLSFDDDRCLEILSSRSMINFWAILWKARALNL